MPDLILRLLLTLREVFVGIISRRLLIWIDLIYRVKAQIVEFVLLLLVRVHAIRVVAV